MHDELSHPDAGADRAELRIRGSRMAVLIALVRGFSRCVSATVGNFWVDLIPGHTLHPAAAVGSAGRHVSVPGRRADAVSISRHRAPGTCCGCRRRACSDAAVSPWARRPPSLRSNSWGTNGGGFLWCKRRTSVRKPHTVFQPPELLAILLIPPVCVTRSENWCEIAGRAGPSWQPWTVIRAAAGPRHLAPTGRNLCWLASALISRRATRSPAGTWRGRNSLRHRQLGALECRDDGGFERVSQRDARLIHSPWVDSSRCG